MKHLKLILTGILVMAWIVQNPMAIRAQDPQTDVPPKPAAKALPPIGGEDDQEDEQPIPAMQPDDLPLTGFQDLTVGTPPESHSYWIPGISYTNFISSNALGAGRRKRLVHDKLRDGKSQPASELEQCAVVAQLLGWRILLIRLDDG